MVASIIFQTLFMMACVVALATWLCYLIATVGTTKRPKRQLPPPPPIAQTPRVVHEETSPPVKPSPQYVPRWGLYRRHWVDVQKAEWDKDFDRLLHDR